MARSSSPVVVESLIVRVADVGDGQIGLVRSIDGIHETPTRLTTPFPYVFEPEAWWLMRRSTLPVVSSCELSSLVGSAWIRSNFLPFCGRSPSAYRAHANVRTREKLTPRAERPKSARRSRLCASFLRLPAMGDIEDDIHPVHSMSYIPLGRE